MTRATQVASPRVGFLEGLAVFVVCVAIVSVVLLGLFLASPWILSVLVRR